MTPKLIYLPRWMDIVRHVAIYGKMTIKTLRRESGMNSTTIYLLVHRLVDQYILKPRQGRVWYLELTPKGVKVAANIQQIVYRVSTTKIKLRR